MNNAPSDTRRKCVFEEVRIPKWERLGIWWRKVVGAITEKPPEMWTRWVEVFPEDERFENAYDLVRKTVVYAEPDLPLPKLEEEKTP